MTTDYHALGICTIEEGRELKDAGYRKPVQRGDFYQGIMPGGDLLVAAGAMAHGGEHVFRNNNDERQYVGPNYLEDYYIRLPRLQELLEWIADQRRSVYPAFAVEMSIMDHWCGVDATGVAPSPAAAPHMLTAAVNAVLQMLRKPNAATPRYTGSGGGNQERTGGGGRDATYGATEGRKLPTFSIATPMRHEYRATTSNNLTFQDTMTFMAEDGWEPLQLAAPTSGTIYQVWRRWVPVEVKS